MLRVKGNRLTQRFGLKLAFPIYLKEFYKGFGSDLERFMGENSRTLPIMARYVIHQDSFTTADDVHPGYTNRQESLKTVDDLM